MITKRPARGTQPPAFRVERNIRQQMDGLELLRSLEPESAALGFLDPQYREVLDKLKFGNEGARQGERADLPQMDPVMIAQFVAEFARVLEPSGHLVLWMDKFCVVTGKWRRWLDDTVDLVAVDMISWNAMRFGMGKRTRGTTEFAVILQKVPTRTDVWRNRSMPDTHSEQSDRSRHPHAKPFILTAALIQCLTARNDLVVDPCAGGYVVLDACKAMRRDFVGCDLVAS